MVKFDLIPVGSSNSYVRALPFFFLRHTLGVTRRQIVCTDIRLQIDVAGSPATRAAPAQAIPQITARQEGLNEAGAAGAAPSTAETDAAKAVQSIPAYVAWDRNGSAARSAARRDPALPFLEQLEGVSQLHASLRRWMRGGCGG